MIKVGKTDEIYKALKLKVMQKAMKPKKNYALIAIGVGLLGLAVYMHFYPSEFTGMLCKTGLERFC